MEYGEGGRLGGVFPSGTRGVREKINQKEEKRKREGRLIWHFQIKKDGSDIVKNFLGESRRGAG